MIKVRIYTDPRIVAVRHQGRAVSFDPAADPEAIYGDCPPAVNFNHISDARRRIGSLVDDEIQSYAELVEKFRQRHGLGLDPAQISVFLIPEHAGYEPLLDQWNLVSPVKVIPAYSTRQALSLVTDKTDLLAPLEQFLGK